MRIVVDTNIIFSAILNSSGKLSLVLLSPKSPFNFYSTRVVVEEIDEHSEKIKELAGYAEATFQEIRKIYFSKIKFIDPALIPKSILVRALQLTENVDIDDTELVALTEHAKAKLWSGDKKLVKGLEAKGWTKFIDTQTLYNILFKKSR